MQQQQQYVPQPMAQMPNAALSQDLLRQLQLGQSRMQVADAQAQPQQAHAGSYAYQQAPRPSTVYGAQPHLQVCLTASRYNVHTVARDNITRCLSRGCVHLSDL